MGKAEIRINHKDTKTPSWLRVEGKSVPEKNKGDLGGLGKNALAHLWRRKKIVKKAHAGRGQEIKVENLN